MADLTALRETRNAYIKAEAEKIANDMVRRNVTTDTLSTCGHPGAKGWGWDVELHNAMSEISTELRKMGIKTTYSVNFGVHDWVFTIMPNA
jgi:hypothetical protein